MSAPDGGPKDGNAWMRSQIAKVEAASNARSGVTSTTEERAVEAAKQADKGQIMADAANAPRGQEKRPPTMPIATADGTPKAGSK